MAGVQKKTYKWNFDHSVVRNEQHAAYSYGWGWKGAERGRTKPPFDNSEHLPNWWKVLMEKWILIKHCSYYVMLALFEYSNFLKLPGGNE